MKCASTRSSAFPSCTSTISREDLLNLLHTTLNTSTHTMDASLSGHDDAAPLDKTQASVAPVTSAAQMSNGRRYALLMCFCLAQFIDQTSGTAVSSAIPVMKEQLGFDTVQAVWLISAFSLTFASFLLLSGRMSDLFNPKWQFSGGLVGVGLLSLGAGFCNSKIPLLVLRAFTGCAAALTIPSALNLLVIIFPEPAEQARAIGAFGACGSIGNILGLVIGAAFVEWVSWRWVFWIVAVTALPLAGVSVMLVPNGLRAADGLSKGERVARLDLFGVSALTLSIVLLIFGITSGTAAGWGSAQVIAPLVLGVLLIGVFLFWETRIRTERAVVPPRTWFYKNFTLLFFVAMVPSSWWAIVINTFMPLWQQVFRWSAMNAAVHAIPVGVVCVLVAGTGSLTQRIEPRWLILAALALAVAGTALFQFCDQPSDYWKYTFPGFILGSSGSILVYINANIAMLRSAPPAMAGTVGAIFNCGIQLGAAVGYAIAGSVEATVEAHSPSGFNGYDGRRAAFRFLLALVCVEFLAVAVFYRRVPTPVGTEEGEIKEHAEDRSSGDGAAHEKA